MLIYRIESEDKIGVYREYVFNLCLNRLNQSYFKGALHPVPASDSKFCQSVKDKGLSSNVWQAVSGKYVFGFESPKQLLRWFFDYDDLNLMGEKGARISVYDCNDVIVGNTQVAFSEEFHEKNNPIKIYSIKEFLDKFGD